jgi:spore germination protein GerM
VIYLPKENKNGFYLAPVTGTTGAKGSILDKAVVALLDTSKESDVTGNLIPKGTRLLSPIKIANGIAQVNLSSDFVNNFSGGSDQEMLTLNSIVQTVIKNSGGRASRVQIKVKGETVDSLGGHLDMTEPLVPDASKFKP